MKLHMRTGLLYAFLFTLFMGGCREKDAPLPDNLIQFGAAEQGIAETEASKAIALRLTRAVSQNTAITVSLEGTGLVYGQNYTTTPAAEGNTIKLEVLSGSSEATITVNKVADAPYYGDEKLTLKIASSASPVIIGTTSQLVLSFAEIVATTVTLEGNGGGETFGNKVFFDLSASTQVGVERTKWDLGFYTGGDFRVILNSSTFMLAKQLDKNDLNAVTVADTAGFSLDKDISFLQNTPPAITAIDYPDGDLTKTAIAEISATDADNKVYIINRGNGIGTAGHRGWKKVRIIRNGGGYTVQHADIDATNFTSVNIAKDDKYFFKYLSFEAGATNIDPEAGKWDIAWTYFSNVTNFGAGEVAYAFQDIFIQNRNVEIVQILEATKSFDSFGEADLAALTLSPKQNAIGSSWRAGGGPGVSPSVHADRYYILKDGDGNYYKVKFTAMFKDGLRGHPTFNAVLIKKG